MFWANCKTAEKNRKRYQKSTRRVMGWRSYSGRSNTCFGCRRETQV